jgi:CHAT domain-containing protein
LPLVLEGGQASRSQLVRRLGESRWRWLHLATHGFFEAVQPPAPAEEGGIMLQGRLPLRHLFLGSGVVLSGANADPGQGLWTAGEVARLDLRGTELVVLSACETGLGLMPAAEGVLGLQRAFHLAGARGVLSSLWNVSDPATSVLMEQFYQRLWADRKTSKREALRQAQLYVLRNPDKVVARAAELREQAGPAVALRGIGKKAVLLPGASARGNRSHPAWWAAFVLSGDVEEPPVHRTGTR